MCDICLPIVVSLDFIHYVFDKVSTISNHFITHCFIIKQQYCLSLLFMEISFCFRLQDMNDDDESSLRSISTSIASFYETMLVIVRTFYVPIQHIPLSMQILVLLVVALSCYIVSRIVKRWLWSNIRKYLSHLTVSLSLDDWLHLDELLKSTKTALEASRTDDDWLDDQFCDAFMQVSSIRI